MNDRIKQLAEQAGFTVENGHIQSLAYKQTEKLAELIVRECSRLCYDNDFATGSGYGEAIEKHFGVK